MLQSLNVKNFAIIDNISIDFNDKMTVLTGETGAGKSLIIDAIGLLFGDRASNEMVRFGESKASIEGVFSNYPFEINDILEDNGIEVLDFLIIKREIYANGKSLSKINGEAVSLNVLNDVSSFLGDIHTQFDSIKLVNPKNYFEFIDNEEIKEIVNLYQRELKKYRVVNGKYQEKLNSQNEKLQRLDFLKYQYNEIKQAKLDLNEEESLQNELRILNNHEKISQNYYDFLSYFENFNLLSNLYEAISSIKKNINFDERLKEKVDRLEESYFNIEDIFDDIKSNFKDDDFDINDLEAINERLGIYSNLKRKYKKTTNELIDSLGDLEKELDELENYDYYLEELEKERNELYKVTLDYGKKISELRRRNANKLTNDLKKVFEELSLKNTTFEIEFKDVNEDSIFKNNGIDVIDFLVSFNKGEPVKPLNKVASGGELSRFMLALKSLSYQDISKKTFIFDEIDSGVSGEVAYNIALKIKSISLIHQVLCVTHLPQVASISDYQLNISKKVIDGTRTVTEIDELGYDERVISIAKMISDGEATNASIALAKELLEKNK